MNVLEQAWYEKARWLILLWPLSVLFQIFTALRRRIQQPASRPASHTVPVVVVGNISVGGTGKTPLLITLANYLKTQGFRPGIISRGYGGASNHYPISVTADTEVRTCGDEAVLLADKTQCPVVIDPDRESALRFLLANEDVNLVLSDDGLQHYKLHRDIEIAVVDGLRLFGNGFCLPAGPLRESIARLRRVDHVVLNGTAVEEREELAAATPMTLHPRSLVNLVSGEKRPFGGAPFNMGNTLQAVSAIGNPERFYDLLNKLPYPMEKFTFPDHHLFSASDFESGAINQRQPVVMTEKDAVKCRQFAGANYWYLAVEVRLPEQFLEKICQQLQALTQQDG